MKKFKNNFGVKGSLPLLMALKEEVEKLGWKYDNDFNPWGRATDLYFNANRTEGSMKTQHFGSSSVTNCTIYNLPQQWDECLKAASELEVEIPEYVECIKAYSLQTKYMIEGYIYKVLDSTNLASIKLQCNRTVKDWSSKTLFICFAGVKEFDFIPSTKEAYEKQQLEEESMEIAGYNVKFKDGKVSIGCYEDITLKDLKIMKKAIKVASKFGKDLTVTEDSIIDNTEDSAIFLDEIEQLIERLDG